MTGSKVQLGLAGSEESSVLRRLAKPHRLVRPLLGGQPTTQARTAKREEGTAEEASGERIARRSIRGSYSDIAISLTFSVLASPEPRVSAVLPPQPVPLPPPYLRQARCVSYACCRIGGLKRDLQKPLCLVERSFVRLVQSSSWNADLACRGACVKCEQPK